MKKVEKLSVLLVCLMVLEFLLVSCGGGKSAFVGKWYLMEGGGNNMPQDIELLKDGTGFALQQAIAWKTEKDRVYITHPMLAMTFDYKISSSRLDLTNNDGKKFVYMKLGGASAIVGTWEVVSIFDNGETKTGDGDLWLINKDGTGESSRGNIKWATEKDMLFIMRALPFKYKIKGDSLTLDQKGEGKYILELKKKK